MEGKNGKAAGFIGRTIRSRFARTRGKRTSEGLLIHSTIYDASLQGDQREEDLVTYSLGKQNRWMLPEMIKTNSSEFEVGEVVVVERYVEESSSKRGSQISCSVFHSTNEMFDSSNVARKKQKRKRPRATSFPKNAEKVNVKTRFEVAYPIHDHSGFGEKIKRPASFLGRRKKSSVAKQIVENDYDDLNDYESFEMEDEENLVELLERTPRLKMDLGLFVDRALSQPLSMSQNGKSIESKLRPREPVSQQKCIYVDSDHEMKETHLKVLGEIREGSSLLDVRNHAIDSSKRQQQKGRKYQRRNQNNRSPENRALLACDVRSQLVEPTCIYPVENDCVAIMLIRQEIVQETLAQEWGTMYKEGGSYPRSFLLNITQLLSVPSRYKDCFIVFRLFEDHVGSITREVKAFVNLVTCGDVDSAERVSGLFTSQIKARSVEQEIWTLGDLLNVSRICFPGEVKECNKCKVDYREPRQPRLSLEIFTKLFGWTSKTYSTHGAQRKIADSVAQTEDAQSVTPRYNKQQECEICYMDMHTKGGDINGSFTLLNACGHNFCNDCWKAHLRTQIELGHTNLKCPGYKCIAGVDDVSLMSLLPSLYGKYRTKKLYTLIEMNPQWKWCPADQCKLICKVAVPQDSFVDGSDCISNVQPLPVACVCGTMWCFKCQEDAHWPATCEEARVFREKNAAYARIMTSTSRKNKLITSVQVKHCPFCSYPVEKGWGCDHMTCILCYKEFCWVCLGKWSVPHQCRNVVNLRKVTLATNHVHVMSLEHVAVTSRKARMSSFICKIHRRLDKIGKELKLLSAHFPFKPDPKKASNGEKHITMMCRNNAAQFLKDVFNFKFQALLVLEGTAIRLAFSGNNPSSKKLALKFRRLLFILQRMDVILKDVSWCLRDEHVLHKLQHFMDSGRNCITLIGQHTVIRSLQFGQ